MPARLYEVVPLEANLRRQPALEAHNILAQLKQGQQVEELPRSPSSPPPGSGCGPTCRAPR